MNLRSLAALLLAVAPITAGAESLFTIAHQGRLLGANEEPVTGATKLTFRIYANAQKPSGVTETALWTAVYTVEVSKGIYGIDLGLTDSDQPALTPELVPPDADRFLAIQVESGAELTPRLRLGTSPRAFAAVRANSAAKADDADKLGGKAPAFYLDAANLTGSAPKAVEADQLGGKPGSYYSNAANLAGTLGTGVTYQGAAIADAQIASASKWDGKLSAVEVTAPITGNGTAGSALGLAKATATVDGYLAKEDFAVFNGKLAAESDPKVGTLAAGRVPRWAGSALANGTLFDDGSKIGIGLNGTPAPVAMLDVGGGIRVGDDQGPCNASRAGTLRYAANVLEICDGGLATPAWRRVGEANGATKNTAGRSCRTIMENGFSVGNGMYWIDPNGGAKDDAFQAYCNMTTDGGGWTLVYRGLKTGDQAALRVNGAVGTLTAPDQTTSAKLDDAIIDLLEVEYVRYGGNRRGPAYDVVGFVRRRPIDTPRFSQRFAQTNSNHVANTSSTSVRGRVDGYSHFAYTGGANECWGYWNVTPIGKTEAWGHYCAGWTSCNFWENTWPTLPEGNCVDGYIYAR